MTIPAVDDLIGVLRAMYKPLSPPVIAADLLEAIDALHQPDAAPEHDPQCVSCGEFWPCTEHRILHPKAER